MKFVVQKIFIGMMIVLNFCPAYGQSTGELEASRFPSLISCVRNLPPLDFCGEQAPLGNPEVRERVEKAVLMSVWDRDQVILWYKRFGRYMPYVENMLKQQGMPDDLKYVAVVESALLPHIGSSKAAVGYWQFIPSTGKNYGLRIDGDIDERRNIFKSTQAAIRYFKDLYQEFGLWTLAAAAYNMGESGLEGRITEQKTRDYYNLYLPLETQMYIPKILAAKLILSNPGKYGFDLVTSDSYQPLQFDRIEIELAETTPIQLIAEAVGTYFKTIKDLNPEIRGSYLDQGRYSILIPKGTTQSFQSRFSSLAQQYYSENTVKKSQEKRVVYTVRPGDSLTGIARKYDVSLDNLLKWNHLTYKSNIQPGQRLVIMK
jgi:hypothetical protein